MSETVVLLAKALIATIVVEEAVALFWKERSIRLAALVLAANVATNPTLNIALSYFSDWIYATPERGAATILLAETAVWGVETAIFERGGRFSPKRAALFALSLNAASFLSGFPLEKAGFWEW